MNNTFRLMLSFAIAVLALLENNYAVIGGMWHEFWGLVIALLVVCHCVLNRKWFAGILVNEGSKSAGYIFRAMLNVLLIIS